MAARLEIEEDPWARLVLGRDWTGDLNEPGGPRLGPLLYVCPGAMERDRRRRAEDRRDFGTRVGSSQPTLGDAGSIREAALVIVDYASSPPIVDKDKEE